MCARDTQTLLLREFVRPPNSCGDKAAGRDLKSSGRRGQERQVHSREEKREQGMGNVRNNKETSSYAT